MNLKLYFIILFVCLAFCGFSIDLNGAKVTDNTGTIQEAINYTVPSLVTAITLGSDTEYETEEWMWNAGAIRSPSNIYTASTSGKLVRAYLRVPQDDSDDTRLSLYDSSNNLAAYSDTRLSVSTGWNEYTFSGDQQINITASAQYYPTLHSVSSLKIYVSNTAGTHQGQLTFSDGPPVKKNWLSYDSTGGNINFYFVVEYYE